MTDLGAFAAVLIWLLARLGHEAEPVIAGAIEGLFRG